MKYRLWVRLVALATLAVALASPAGAATTDIEPLRTIVTRAPGCTLTPNTISPICIKVVVKNNGPDPYVGTEPGKSGGLPSISAGQLKVTVDIDEPSSYKTDPGALPQIQAIFTRNFPVTIAAGDSAVLDFGPVAYQTSSPGSHTAVATTFAQAPNIDPNSANDRKLSIFFVLALTPAMGPTGVAALLAALAGLTTVHVWRRRRRAG
jgi:hypothetical protein